MGRQLRRVPLDFDWPIGVVWKGFVNPYSGMKCSACDGSGSNPAVKRLSDDWYGFERPERRWSNNITQDEVDALVKERRLLDLTSRWDGEKREYVTVRESITAKEVNEWSKGRGLGHDAINQWICVETRAKRLGIWGKDGRCEICHGHGDIFPDESFRELQENYEYTDPPTGDGYQLWETTSEGSAVSPVFSTPHDLATWLVRNPGGITSDTTYEEWMRFIEGPGWAPSLMAATGVGIMSGVKGVTGGLVK